MGVYRKVGEINGEDQYRQLDSRRNGHVLHLQLKINLETDQFQWQIEKPFSSNHNGSMRKWVDPANTSLFSPTSWMFDSNNEGRGICYGKLMEDENCKVAKFSPFMHERCNRITIKTPTRSGGGSSIICRRKIYFYHFSIQVFTCPLQSTVQEGLFSLTHSQQESCICLSILRLESGR